MQSSSDFVRQTWSVMRVVGSLVLHHQIPHVKPFTIIMGESIQQMRYLRFYDSWFTVGEPLPLPCTLLKPV